MLLHWLKSLSACEVAAPSVCPLDQYWLPKAKWNDRFIDNLWDNSLITACQNESALSYLTRWLPLMPVTAPGWDLVLYFDFAIMGKTFESGPELKAAGQAQSREQLTWQASLHGSMSKGAGIYVQHLLSWKRSEILPVITLLSVGSASIMPSSCFIVFFFFLSCVSHNMGIPGKKNMLN